MAGGKRGDEFNSQVMQAVAPVDLLARAPDPNEEARAERASEAELEALRAAARERDEIVALEVRLLHNSVRRQQRDTSKMVDTLREIASSAVTAATAAAGTDASMLEAIRENRDAIQQITQTVTIETPQLLKQLLEVATEIKEYAATIATAIALKTSNGHGETT